MDISCVLAALLLIFPQEKNTVESLGLCENAYCNFLFKIVLIKLSEKICSHWCALIFAAKSSVTLEKICQLKCEILKLCDLLASIDRARWLFLFYFGLSL